MRTSIGIFALALTGSMAVAGAAYAADRGSFDVDQVVVAYSDGYMGTDNQFHAWENRIDAREVRAKHLDRYRPYAHDDKFHKQDGQ